MPSDDTRWLPLASGLWEWCGDAARAARDAALEGELRVASGAPITVYAGASDGRLSRQTMRIEYPDGRSSNDRPGSPTPMQRAEALALQDLLARLRAGELEARAAEMATPWTKNDPWPASAWKHLEICNLAKGTVRVAGLRLARAGAGLWRAMEVRERLDEAAVNPKPASFADNAPAVQPQGGGRDVIRISECVLKKNLFDIDGQELLVEDFFNFAKAKCPKLSRNRFDNEIWPEVRKKRVAAGLPVPRPGKPKGSRI